MLERLVECWLDSASERSFQAPFCQVLTHQGHAVLHSTRHASIEFGKDLVTLDSEGVINAYQLKGHPGGRLTLREFRTIQAQLHELVHTPIVHPGIESSQHRSFLVTNGEIEEEVRVYLEAANAKNAHDGYPERTLAIISRGELLGLFQTLGHALWPSEISDMATLTELMALDGASLLPATKLETLVGSLLHVQDGDALMLKQREAERRVTSAAVLVAVALHRFEAASNHAAMIHGWLTYILCVVACLERHGLKRSTVVDHSILNARKTILRKLQELALEVMGDESGGREPFHLAEGAVYQARTTLVSSLLSVLFLWMDSEAEEHQSIDLGKLRAALKENMQHLLLWGQGATPQLLAFYWFLRRSHAGWGPENFLVTMVDSHLPRWNNDSWQGLPQPYFGYEDVARHYFRNLLENKQNPLLREDTGSGSFFLHGLFLLLVRTNRKVACRRAWPDASRVLERSFIPADSWRFCLHRTNHGKTFTRQWAPTQEWSSMIEKAQGGGCEYVPEGLLSDPILLLLTCIFRPWRATTEVVLRLGRMHDRTWY